MITDSKITIVDNQPLRAEIVELFENASHIDLAKWSLSMAKHILNIVGIDYTSENNIQDGFDINELWQLKKVKVHKVRQAGFKIHKLARESNDEIQKTALRVAGQAVASGHMSEHSLVASDYAVKTIGLLYKNDIDAITRERQWQLDELKRILCETAD